MGQAARYAAELKKQGERTGEHVCSGERRRVYNVQAHYVHTQLVTPNAHGEIDGEAEGQGSARLNPPDLDPVHVRNLEI